MLNRMFAMMIVAVSFVSVAGHAAASDIANITTTVTDLFVDLIPLIVILGVFGLILGAMKLRK